MKWRRLCIFVRYMRFRYNVLNVNVSIEVQWLNGKHISSFSKTCGVLTKYIYAGRRRRQGGDIVRRQPLCQIKSSEVDNDEEDDDDDDGEGDDHDDSRLYVLIHLRQYCHCGGQTWDREIMPSVYVDARSVFIWSKNDPMPWQQFAEIRSKMIDRYNVFTLYKQVQVQIIMLRIN